MSQVRVASRAQYLGASHEKRAVGVGADVLFGDRLVKARPSGARLELGIGTEQRRGAADAPVEPLVVVFRILVGIRRFGAFLASDFVLLGCQELAPLVIRLRD